VQPRFTADRIAFVNLGSIGKAAISLPVSVNFLMVNSASLISIAPKSKIMLYSPTFSLNFNKLEKYKLWTINDIPDKGPRGGFTRV
jgi:hypothetical protein